MYWIPIGYAKKIKHPSQALGHGSADGSLGYE